jgi:hypothetical protein
MFACAGGLDALNCTTESRDDVKVGRRATPHRRLSLVNVGRTQTFTRKFSRMHAVDFM